MNIQTKYPLLLTLVEHKYLTHHYQDERSSADVYKALYLQGEHLQDDRVVHWKPLSTRPDLDERGLGWKDAHCCWISRGQQTLQVSTGQEATPADLPEGLASASGRYLWTTEQSAALSALRQLDRQSGEISTLWQKPAWAALSLASDPRQDRLGWAQAGPLQSWDPTQGKQEVIRAKFAEDFSGLAFSPDGEQLAFLHDQQVYCLHDGTTDSISGPRSNSFNYRLQPGWSPDGKRLFYISAHYDIEEDDLMHESYQWMAATPNGSQSRMLLSGSALAAVQVGPRLE